VDSDSMAFLDYYRDCPGEWPICPDCGQPRQPQGIAADDRVVFHCGNLAHYVTIMGRRHWRLKMPGRHKAHPTAEVSGEARVGQGTVIWHQAQVREGARIGASCRIGKGAYIGAGVVLGENCKVQNYACIYRGAILGDGVFVGPHAILVNDRVPRAINEDGTLKSDSDWEVLEILVGRGAAIGAGAVVLPGIRIGEWAMIGAGAVVTRNVPAHALVLGMPGRVHASWEG
jgi:acetyltransferase-like isoleucine patch superfamily enzyme